MAIELSIVMPCLNEARTLPACVEKAQTFLATHRVSGEVVVADNGSTDGSREIALRLGARLVPVPVRGYGAALQAGIAAASGRFVIMGDSDDSYDFLNLMPFLEKLRDGYDVVMGNRFRGGIKPGAMPVSHRYFGNPVLSAIGRLFFRNRSLGDFYCGLRGFRKEAVQRLQLQSRGMEFALEMLIKAGMHGLRITEVPTTLSPDGRDRAPHLRTLRDGWRSLRLLLMMSPKWFFGVPGALALAGGASVTGVLASGPLAVWGVKFDYHTMIYGAGAVVIGYQSLMLAAFAKLMAVEAGLHPPVTRLWFLEERSMFERLLIAGASIAAAGVALGVWATRDWSEANFGDLTPTSTIRLVIFSVLALVLGGQTMLAGCFLGMFNLLAGRRQQRAERPTTEAAAQRGEPTLSSLDSARA